MMKAEATVSAQDKKIATYYVVPVIPGEGSTETVLYYEESPTSDNWRLVSPKDLNAKHQGGNENKIKLLQPTPERIEKFAGLPSGILDETARLYAGVARAFAMYDDQGSVYPLCDGALTIPVTSNTVRGLILIFTKGPASGTSPYPVTQLIASTDPEIKNSTGGNCVVSVNVE